MSKPVSGPSFDTRLQALIYEGMDEPEPWVGFVDEVRRQSMAHTVMLTFWDPKSPSHSRQNITSSQADRSRLLDAYETRFLAFDPIRYGAMVPGRGYRLEDFTSREAFENSAYFRDFLAPVGIHHIMCVHLTEPGGLKGWLVLGRGRQLGAFGQADIVWLERVATSLRRAMSLFAQHKRISFDRRLYGGILRTLKIGLISLDAGRRVVATNDVADSILARGDCVRLVGKRIEPVDATQTAAFRTMIDRVIQGSGPPRQMLRLSRRQGNTVEMLVSAITDEDATGLAHHPRIMLSLTDPGAGRGRLGLLIGDLWGITPSEARLAELLVEGLSVADAAILMGISQNSARTYLKRIYANTGFSRQSELVAAFMRSIALVAEPEELGLRNVSQAKPVTA